MRRYPPILPRLRPFIYGLRAVGIVLLLGGFWVGWNLIDSDQTLAGIRVVLAGIAFAAGTWVSVYSPLFLVLLAIPVLILPLTTGSGVVFAVIAAVALLLLALRRAGPVAIDADQVRRADDDAVMPHAVRFVAGFEDMGWTRAGAVVAQVESIEVTIAVLLSPDRRSYVEVTDVVLAITSTFSQGRTLVSRNSASSPMAEWALANDHRGASPAQLAAAHQEVLDILSEREVEALRLDPDNLIELVIELEKLSIEGAAGFTPGITNTAKGQGPIDRSEPSTERVRRWIHTTGPDLSDHLGDRPD